MKNSLTVTIITLNEEKNIQRAISSVQFADEVIVIDSGSEDRTVEIAKELGAKVIQQPFLGFGQQKNFAASHAQSDWILNIDADEEVSPLLKESLQKILSDPFDKLPVAYRLNRLNFFCNKPIKHGGWYPDWNLRLIKAKKGQWTQPHVHEKLVPSSLDSSVENLKGHLNHYSFSTLKSQVLTNLKFAGLGAKDLYKRKKGSPLFLELLIRPFFKFIECYFLKLGFLDGRYGILIALNASYSMFMKYSFAYQKEFS